MPTADRDRAHGTRLALAARMTTKPRAKPLYVTVVSNNAETLRGLQAYFDEAGVPTHGTRAIDDLSSVAPATTAVVLFPDDFAEREVLEMIATLQHARPRLLMLVVTAQPRIFDEALAPDGRSLVLPKPSFGWAILDAIRAHAHASPS